MSFLHMEGVLMLRVTGLFYFHMFVFCLLSFKTCGTKTALLPIWYVLLVCPSLSSLSESPLTQTSTSPRLFFPLFPSVSCLNTSSLKRHPICEPVLTFPEIYKKKTKKNPYVTSPLAEKGPTFAFSKSSLGGFGSASPGYTSV